MLWLDYYNNSFLRNWELFTNLQKKSNDKISLCNGYIELFFSACELIKLFLHYNGIFHFRNIEIIKEAYSIELIEQGEKWMNALFYVNEYKAGNSEQFASHILSYCKDENFIIFNDLKNKFEKLKEEYV